jgi:hypothetical protein
LTRIEWLEQRVVEDASNPLSVEKPPWNEEDEGKAYRIFKSSRTTRPRAIPISRKS